MDSQYTYELIEDSHEQSNVQKRMLSKRFDKFLLLMWKNWLLQIRRPLPTAIEILSPVMFSILLVVIRSLVDPETHDAITYDPFYPALTQIRPENSTDEFRKRTSFKKSELSIAYSPINNSEIEKAMNIMRKLLDVKGFDSQTELVGHFHKVNTTFAAIQFSDTLKGQNYLPDDLEVTIRFPGELRFTHSILVAQNNWKTNLLYPIFQEPGPRAANNKTGGAPSYYLEGFLTVQTLITYFLAYRNENISSTIDIIKLNAPVIFMQRYPYARWVGDPMLRALESFASIIIMLSFVYSCINTVKLITAEKEKQLKEAMKIMGLPNWLHWTAWFIKSFVFLSISVTLIIILLKVSWYPGTNFSVFTYADPSVLLFFLLLYICSTITFCFAISVFFSKANSAATVAGLLWFLSYSSYLLLQVKYDQLSLGMKLVASLGSNSAMGFGIQVILMFEGTSEGIQWSNIFKPNTPDDTLTLGLIMIMLVFDTFLYLLIAIYVEAVFPGEYGIPQPWYFPFTYNYWFGRPRYVGVEDVASTSSTHSEFFERDPTYVEAGIQIKNLRKVFGKKAAVRNLTLNMYDNQITVLLGHNGAGKTTTMLMLTGIIPPTSGTAVIGGHDIKTDMGSVRDSLGLCPQHNILFDDLTVREHLYFFSKLKGLRKEEIQREIETYLELLELEPKANAKSSTLSGGMKRKLCVVIALCGNSKVVMLDEPTAGMDPAARRALWDLLQSQKQGRTIMLSTHFMDEADLLGDRIAIMAGGELQCCGSSFFLKKKYGAGYNLIMDISKACEPSRVTSLLQKHIPSIRIQSHIGSELSYLLEKKDSPSFERMLQDLEQHSKELNVRSYGISLTTLEEVFMKVGADHGQEETYNIKDPTDASASGGRCSELMRKFKSKFSKSENSSPRSPETKLSVEDIVLLTGVKLVFNQFKAMLKKKLLSIARTWPILFIQNLLPVVFLTIAILMMRYVRSVGDLPKLPITLNSYEHSITLISTTTTNKYMDTYKELLGRHEKKEVENITDLMLDLTKNTPISTSQKYLVGATFDRGDVELPLVNVTVKADKITAWFNNNPYHTPPLALGLALGAFYKKQTGQTIRFSNQPFPYTTNTKVKQLLSGNSMGFQVAFNVAFSMAFVSSFYVLFIIRERVSNSKHLQFVSGVKVYVFWITSYVCDLATFFITIFCLLLTLVAFQESGFSSFEDLCRMFFNLYCFGISFIPMMYVSGYLFEIPSTGFTRMTLFSVFTGVTAYLVVVVLKTPSLELEYIADGMHWGLLIVPHYCLAASIQDSYVSFSYNKLCNMFVDECTFYHHGNSSTCWSQACQIPSLKGACCVKKPEFYKWEYPGIGRNVFYSLIIGSVLFLSVMFAEYKFLARSTCIKKQRLFNDNPDEDDDVIAEKHTIRNLTDSDRLNNYTLVLQDVTKYYQKFLAVNGLCLGVKQNECFGLLGINGAGKTTTFKMMTGDVKITHGNAWVKNTSIKTNITEVQKLIGYCPQFDALLDDLTSEETLVMFALLRGVPSSECKYLAQKLSVDLDFSRHLHKQIKEMSGGNKRKVSTAISLIGNPPVIYLDEPTTGMDPATKRYLWNAICKVRDSGKCVVLTSHSMEECEALCTRLAIMVNGNFKCLGSTQHLKNKYAEGYTLTIKIKKTDDGRLADTGNIEKFILERFPKSVQREKHQELLTYYIVDKSIPWSGIFGIIEKMKSQLNIEDYSLGQASLEQVFLSFTKSQRED